MSIAEKLTTVAENVPKVYEAGQQDVLKALSNNYTRTEWQNAFRRSDFSGLSFPQTIKVTNAYYMFTNYAGKYLPGGFDFSGQNAHDMTHLCRYDTYLLVFPDMGIKAQNAYGGTWQFCESLHTIEVVRCTEETTFSASFSGCYALKTITFEGTIGQNIDFGVCPLVKESILNVFEHLSGTASGKTATFKQLAVMENVGSPYEQEWLDLVATKPNWTISLV